MELGSYQVTNGFKLANVSTCVHQTKLGREIDESNTCMEYGSKQVTDDFKLAKGSTSACGQIGDIWRQSR